MAWFNRKDQGIQTPTALKIEAPDGLWYKCPECKTITSTKVHADHLWVCPSCQYHGRIGSAEYFSILFDDGSFEELDGDMISDDPLRFTDSKPYSDRITQTISRTRLKDAVRTGVGHIHGHPLVVACMDFGFIGGSMGSVVGEKIARAIERGLADRSPVMVISKSGGARMMEAGYSLMQMAKTSARLAQLAQKGVPYISMLTDPTTGGVTASFAMLGDFNIAEPGALIGFAGPRVIRETIGKDLPEGFQSSEFVLEHGFLDMIVHRRDLRTQVAKLLAMVE